jgi:hypothetical protein
VYVASHPHSYYDDRFSILEPDVAHLVVRELFAWLGDDRYSSRSVYLQIYARPSAYPIDDNYYGGGLVRVARFRISFLGRPRCCGRASACGANIVSRRKLLLQRQPE